MKESGHLDTPGSQPLRATEGRMPAIPSPLDTSRISVPTSATVRKVFAETRDPRPSFGLQPPTTHQLSDQTGTNLEGKQGSQLPIPVTPSLSSAHEVPSTLPSETTTYPESSNVAPLRSAAIEPPSDKQQIQQDLVFEKPQPPAPLVVSARRTPPPSERRITGKVPEGPSPLQLQKDSSALPPPDVPRDSKSHYALLSTNEDIPPTPAVTRTITKFNANGYLIGPGAGRLFTMTDLFPEGTSPRGILSADPIPDVVLGGRVIVDLLQRVETPEHLVTVFGTDVSGALTRVIQAETSPANQALFEQAAPLTAARLQEAAELYHTSREDIERYQVENVLSQELIQRFLNNFDLLKGLATQGRMGFVLQDITNPEFLSLVTSLQGYEGARNVIYLSNIVDHITQRGRADQEFPRLANAQEQLRAPRGESLYVFTSARDPKKLVLGAGVLQVSTRPPTRADYFGTNR